MKFSEFFGDKIFEKVKLDRLKTIILKSITKDIEDLIRNELLRNKYTLPEKSSDEIYKKEINMLREELKSEDFIIRDLLQTIKEMKTLRTDDGKAALTVSQLTNHLLQLDIDIIDNRNINARNLGNKGLHLNPTGTSRLAKNLLSSIKSF